MSETLDAMGKTVAEIRDKVMQPDRPANTGNIVQFHGSAPGWTMANALIAMACLGMMGVMAAMLWGMNQRISDMQDRLNADAIELNDYKIANEARARTDRLLLNKIEVALTEKGIKP